MATTVCDKHNLRYDPETQSGCVVCRREAGASANASAPAVAPAEESLARPLAAAAAIWMVSALVLFAAHRQLAAAFVMAPEEAAFGLELEPAELDPTKFDPNAPPGAGSPSLGPQTDEALRELEALGREREERTGGPDRPLGLPTHDELSQDAETLEQVEGAETAPLEMEVGAADDEDGGR